MKKQMVVRLGFCLLMFIGATVTQAQGSEGTVWQEASTDAGWPKMEEWLKSKGYIQGELILLEGLALAMAEAYKCDASVCGRQFLELNGTVKPNEAAPKWITVGHFKLIGQNGGWKLPASAISATAATAKASAPQQQQQETEVVDPVVIDPVLKSIVSSMIQEAKKENYKEVQKYLLGQLEKVAAREENQSAGFQKQVVAAKTQLDSVGQKLAALEKIVADQGRRTTALEGIAGLLGIRFTGLDSRVAGTEAAIESLKKGQIAQAKQIKDQAKVDANQAKAIQDLREVISGSSSTIGSFGVALATFKNQIWIILSVLLMLCMVGLSLSRRIRGSNKSVKDLENNMRVETSNLLNKLREEFKTDLGTTRGNSSFKGLATKLETVVASESKVA